MSDWAKPALQPQGSSELLREQFASNRTLVVAGVHDSISAVLAQKAAFDAVWLSGFGLSVAQKALPDANLLTMTEVLMAAQNIVRSVATPLIVDCDNGYGTAINVTYAVREFERAGVAGICIEDNSFPKRNSFYEDVAREVIPTAEMEAKIRAGKAAQRNAAFFFMARTEALVVGQSVDEALERAYAYENAGADGVLVHAKAWPPLNDFLMRWRGSVPLVVVPTMFPEVSPAELTSQGVRMIIYANQALRASIRVMQTTLGSIQRAGLSDVQDLALASMDEIAGLVGIEEPYAHDRRSRVLDSPQSVRFDANDGEEP